MGIRPTNHSLLGFSFWSTQYLQFLSSRAGRGHSLLAMLPKKSLQVTRAFGLIVSPFLCETAFYSITATENY